MTLGRQIPAEHNLSSLRLLGSVGEPINPEAWRWYREAIGAGKTPIVDTWWQTETGAIRISPLPGVTATKPWAGPGWRDGQSRCTATAPRRRCLREHGRSTSARAVASGQAALIQTPYEGLQII